MLRRHLLVFGAGTAAIWSVASFSAAWLRPARNQGQFTAPVRVLMAVVAEAVLGDLLPRAAKERAAALAAVLGRLESTVAGMNPSTQAEMDRLLALLVTPPGRWALLRLATPWPEATPSEVQAALQGMRSSTLSLRQQIFHALRDLTAAAYFADASTWPSIGYPGPRAL